GVLASIEVNPTFIEEIKAKKFEDVELIKLKSKVVSGETLYATLDADGVLSFRGRICVPRVCDLIQSVLVESHGFWEALERVRRIQDKLMATQSRQKKYAYHKVMVMLFQVGDNVLLKVSHMKGVMRFFKKGKLSPRYIGTFEILDGMGTMANKLALSPNFS
ncbi:hypothetical protein MTR67_039803, partial [Solanum verrucosum]